MLFPNEGAADRGEYREAAGAIAQARLVNWFVKWAGEGRGVSAALMRTRWIGTLTAPPVVLRSVRGGITHNL
jgi:hypothetical protein